MADSRNTAVVARKPRFVIPGYPHHVTQRGNHRQSVFYSDADRRFYLELLRRQVEAGEVVLPGYALMTNHVHEAMIPRTPDSFSRAMRTVHRDFARIQNLRSNRTGHLWQGRFFSCPVHNVWDVLAYIELNPVRAGMVASASDWEWSSARAHLAGEDHSGLLDMDLWRSHFDPCSWREYLRQAAFRTEINDRIRRATTAGRFCGPEEIAKQLEREFRKAIRGQRESSF
jgi:putative transposase